MYENNPNSQKDVVSIVDAVLGEFEHSVKQELNGIAVQYDSALTYETGIQKYLADNEIQPNEEISPIFIYNRSITSDGDTGLQQRARHKKGIVKVENGTLNYSVYHGEYTINFMYVTQSVEQAQRFELSYHADQGISACKKLTVDIPEIGPFDYFLRYNELEDLQFEKEGMFYYAVIGSIKVRGFYFTFNGTSVLIKELNSRIISSNNIPDRKIDEILASNL